MYFAVDPLDVADVTSQLMTLIEANSKANWIAVVDRAFDHGGSALACHGTHIVLYSSEELDALSDVSPLLIPLITEEKRGLEEQLLSLAQHCAGRPMLSVVASAKHVEEIKLNWQKCARVVTDDGQKMLLRFADTRVLPVLAETLRQESWVALTHELIGWWYIDRAGELMPAPIAATDTAPAFPIAIGRHGLSQMLERNEPDAVIDRIFAQTPEILPKSNKAAFFERMRNVCDFAREREVEAFPDVVALGAFDIACRHQGLENPRLLKLVADRGWSCGEMAAALIKLLD